jgi:DNA-binding transcriptional LysR family regulator
MDLVALQIFKAVAESGGISRAAARLHRVQSNVTTRVKQLEQRLGTRLFHRRNRRLVLSDEGRILLDYAERLLRLSSEAEAAMRSTRPRGTLRLGSLESTAATRLPGLLAAYHRAWPEVGVELVTGTSGSLVERVLRGELDAAFVAEPFTASGLAMRHAFTEHLVVIAPRGAAGLAHLPVLAFAAGCSYRRRLEAWLHRSGIAPGRVMEYGSYHAIAACVAAGGGIAIVPEAVLNAMRTRLEVSIRPLPRDIAQARTQLVWREGHQSGALDALGEALVSAARSAAPARRGAASRACRSA